jgi:DNA-binding PadR family transcriptional regulator
MSIRRGLLALLRGGSKYGYQLRGEFEAATAGAWPLNVGQVYATLARLERDGLVTPDGPPDDLGRMLYRVTDTGRAEVTDWFAAPIEHEARPRDELMIKLAMALADPTVDTLALLGAQRTAARRAIQAATTRKAELTRKAADEPPDLSGLLIIEAAIFAAEAEVRWLDHCEAVLRANRSTR